MITTQQKIDFKEFLCNLLRKGYTVTYKGHNNFYEWYSLNRLNFYATIDISIGFDGSVAIDTNYITVTRELKSYVNRIIKFLTSIDDKQFIIDEMKYYNDIFNKISNMIYGIDILLHTYDER